MYCVSRNRDEGIVITVGGTRIVIKNLSPQRIRLGVSAPRDVPVVMQEDEGQVRAVVSLAEFQKRRAG